MNSTKSEQSRVIGRNPFSNYLTQYQNYLGLVELNSNILKERFPLEDKQKIKSLLEQLDNNLDMVVDILEEEYGQSIPTKKDAKIQTISLQDQNMILKKAFKRLYRQNLEIGKLYRQYVQIEAKLHKQNQHLCQYHNVLAKRDQNKTYNKGLYLAIGYSQ